MIQISTLFELIQIPTESEFSIYTKDYYVDQDGNTFDKAPSGEVYAYGDLYIETVSTQYVFRRVYAAYDYCATLLEMLREWNGEGSISIRLESLNKTTEFFAEGGFEKLQKRSPITLRVDKDGPGASDRA